MRTLFAVTRSKGRAWDASRPLRSQEQWLEHAAFMDGLTDAGFIILGGPLGEGDTILLIVDTADEETIHSMFALDPWSESGLLEIQSIQQWTILLQAGKLF